MPKQLRRFRRGFHLLLALILGLVGLLAIVLLTMQIPTARRELLEVIVQRIKLGLPGNVQIDNASWPRLSELRIQSFMWTTSADTLATGDDFVLRFNPSSLWRRHLQIDEVVLQDLQMDLLSIQALLQGEAGASPASRPAVPSRRARNAGGPILRPGGLPGLPSLTVESIAVRASRLILSSGISVDSLQLRAAVDLKYDRVPRFQLLQLRFRMPEAEVAIDTCSVTVDLASERLEAHARGFYARDWPFMLAASTDETGHFEIALQHPDPTVSGSDVGLRLAGDFERADGGLQALRFAGDLKTPGVAELRRSPGLAARLEDLPDLEGIHLRLAGRMNVRPEWTAEVEADVQPSSWLTAGHVRVRSNQEGVDVDSLALAFQDASLGGRWRSSKGTQNGRLEVRASGSEWLRPYLEAKDLPDSLAIQLTATVDGNERQSTVTTDAEIHLRRGALQLEPLRFVAVVPRLQDPQLRLHLHARTPTLSASVKGIVLPGPLLTVQLTPVEIAVPGAEDGTLPRLPLTEFQPASNIQVDVDSNLVVFENVFLSGALGEVKLTGRVQTNNGGRARLAMHWPEPPEILMARLGGSEDAKASLRETWRGAGPLGLSLETTLQLTSQEKRVQATGQFAFPGPRTLRPLLATNAEIEDLGDLQGGLVFGFNVVGRKQEWNLRLDLDETTWIDSFVVWLHGDGEGAVLDRVVLETEGARADLSGWARPDSLEIGAQLSLRDDRLVHRWAPQLQDTLDVHLDLTAQLQGSTAAPDAQIDLEAACKSASFQVPQVRGAARIRRGRLQDVRLEAASGLQVQALELDRVRVDYDALEDSTRQLPARVVVEAKGAAEELFSVFELERDAGVLVRSDTLSLRSSGLEFRSQAPFEVHVFEEGSGLRLGNVHLAGPSGHLRASGVKKPDSLLFNVDTQLVLPQQPDWLLLPAGLWPASMNLQGSTQNGDVKLTLEATDLKIGTRTGLALNLQVLAQDDSLSTELTISDARGSMVEAHGSIPAQWNLAPPSLRLSDERVMLDARLTHFPLPPRGGDLATIPGYLDRQTLTRTPSADARLQILGSLPQPEAQLIGRIDFPEYGELALYEFRFQADVVTRSRSTAFRPGAPGQGSLQLRPQEPGLHVVLSGSRNQLDALQGELRAPLELSLEPFSFETDADKTLFLRLEAPQLQMADFNPLLPGGIQLQGTLQAKVTAIGASADPTLDGRVDLPGLRMTRSDGLRAQARGGIRLHGSGRRPIIDGRIQLINGVIPVPDAPKELLPAEGTPLLQSRSTPRPAPEARQPAPGARRTGSTISEAATQEPIAVLEAAELDVTLSVPSGVWIRGKGLEVEVAGDLRLQQQEGRTMVVGELQAVRGSLALQGRKIPIKSGKVIFYGDDETNPTLDLILEKKFEKVTVTVKVSGKVKDPKLELGSDPELSDQDILSYLFFGKPLKSLDNSQTTGLEQRAVGIASTFATSRVTGWLSQELGLEMLSIEQSSQKEDVKALVVGKYISPNILLKYAQDLEKGRGFSINLEYWLARGLKMATYTSRYDQSGVELNWSRDY